jgi:hypothetical protein
MVKVKEAFCYVLGMGEGEVRYRISFLPKNRSGSGEVISAGTFPLFTLRNVFWLNIFDLLPEPDETGAKLCNSLDFTEKICFI